MTDCNKEDVYELIGFIYQHANGDYGVWNVVLPEEAQARILTILAEYDTLGHSMRGSRTDFCVDDFI